jgi:hypothetical protein
MSPIEKIRNKLHQRWSTTTNQYVARRIGCSEAVISRFLSGLSNSTMIAQYAADNYGPWYQEQFKRHLAGKAMAAIKRKEISAATQEFETSLGLGFGPTHKVLKEKETHRIVNLDKIAGTTSPEARAIAGYRIP